MLEIKLTGISSLKSKRITFFLLEVEYCFNSSSKCKYALAPICRLIKHFWTENSITSVLSRKYAGIFHAILLSRNGAVVSIADFIAKSFSCRLGGKLLDIFCNAIYHLHVLFFYGTCNCNKKEGTSILLGSCFFCGEVSGIRLGRIWYWYKNVCSSKCCEKMWASPKPKNKNNFDQKRVETKKHPAKFINFAGCWRRVRDSNPRWVFDTHHWFSRPTP